MLTLGVGKKALRDPQDTWAAGLRFEVYSKRAALRDRYHDLLTAMRQVEAQTCHLGVP
jgi:hypothetical protein